MVMRHAYAGDYIGRKEDKSSADIKRPLQQDGLDAVDALIDWLGSTQRDAIPNSISCSPITRALQTAQRIGKALGVPVTVNPNLGIGKPMEMVIKAMALDPSVKRPLIVSHSDNINPGLRWLNALDATEYDPIAMCELRWLKVDRSDATWSEVLRVLPSDLGQTDYY